MGAMLTKPHALAAVADRAAAGLPRAHFADPHLVSFDGRFYLYPTTDGIEDWGATTFSAFSSADLITWTDHGEIFSLRRDTKWATSHAWAPAVAHRNGLYFLFYTADQEYIGVAVAPSPTGPFYDLGHPLISRGDFEGRAIDPSVFVDRDGSAYLYWGNSVAHGVKLNADMMSFDAAAVHSWTPGDFCEAAWVHEHNSIYYLSWSENDTRDLDYRVCYATAPSPLGPWTEQGTVIEKAPERGIFATGHHSILRLPDTDEWLIAYHRFAIPDGNGYRREVVIDRLHHDTNGLLAQVIPSAAGVPL